VARNYRNLDFDITIGHGDDGVFPVEVVCPEGQFQSALRLPFEAEEREQLVRQVEEAIQAKPTRRAGSRVAPLVQLGGALFDSLIEGQVRKAFDTSHERVRNDSWLSLRIRLKIRDAQVAALPWELLYDAREDDLGFIGRSRKTPLVRQVDTPLDKQPTRAPFPVRILGVGFSPADSRGNPGNTTPREHRRLKALLHGLSTERKVDLNWLDEGVTWDSVGSALCRDPWHILHFVGDGQFDRDLDEGCLTLIDDQGVGHTVTSTDFTRLVRDNRALKLVVLNACEGARESLRRPNSSTAAMLVRYGVPAVLAMQYRISDQAAVEIASVVYRSLADGLLLEPAVAEARNRISLSPSLGSTLEWASPVLFTRRLDGPLFGRPRAARVSVQVTRQPRPGPEPIDLDQDWLHAVRLLQTGKYRDAYTAWKALNGSRPDPRARAMMAVTANQLRIAEEYERARSAITRQDWREAIDLLRPIIETSPDYADAAEMYREATLNFQREEMYAEARTMAAREDWEGVLNALDRLTRVAPTFSDPDRLGPRASAAIEEARRERINQELYARAEQAIAASDWATALAVLEDLEERQPGYRNASEFLWRARRELSSEPDPPLAGGTPEHSRALAYCLLYEMEPQRYAVYLPRLIETLQLPSNRISPDVIFPNLMSVVGLPVLARHISLLDDDTRTKLAEHLARYLDKPDTEQDEQSASYIRRLVGESLRDHFNLASTVDEKHGNDFIVEYGSLTRSELDERVQQHAAALRTTGDILDYVLGGADAT
jgi:tetratricopeptide (TPR) repeat protein